MFGSLGVGLEKTLNLTPTQINSLLEKIKNDSAGYVTMRNTVYTTSTKTGDDRTVSLGDKGVGLSTIQSKDYTPAQGLSIGHITSHDYFKDIG